MKSSFSQGQSNCVDVTLTRDGNVRVRDTKRKTGDVELEFTPEEWLSFKAGVRNYEFELSKIPYDTTDDRPMTNEERREMERAFKSTSRTPENLAYVNGRHAERAGWVPYSFEAFCRRFKHDKADDASRRLYDSFQTGRRAEVLEGI